VFIDGLYANGIAATLVQMPGLPAATYALSVYVPDRFTYLPKPQVDVLLVSGAVAAGVPYLSAVHTQPGISLSVTP
jgi:hypothetical protein